MYKDDHDLDGLVVAPSRVKKCITLVLSFFLLLINFGLALFFVSTGIRKGFYVYGDDLVGYLLVPVLCFLLAGLSGFSFYRAAFTESRAANPKEIRIAGRVLIAGGMLLASEIFSSEFDSSYVIGCFTSLYLGFSFLRLARFRQAELDALNEVHADNDAGKEGGVN